jgi:hypothetical protein
LREKFRRKAFERRQEVMILALRGVGYEDPAICGMTLGAYDQIDFGSGEVGRQKSRYREVLIERRLARLPGDRAFVTYEGHPVRRHELATYLQRLRGVRINMEFNSSLCRGLLATRYSEPDAVSKERTRVRSILSQRLRVPITGAVSKSARPDKQETTWGVKRDAKNSAA